MPAFDEIEVEHFLPALDEAMDAYRTEIRFGDPPRNPDCAPTFANTLWKASR